MEDKELWGEMRISDFLAVRAAIMDVSKRTVNMPTIDRLRSRDRIETAKNKAKKAGVEAEKFDPHSRLFSLLEWISIRKRLIITLIGLISITAHFILDVSAELVVKTFSAVSSPILLTGILGVILYTLWNAYLVALHYNRHVVQKVNSIVRYSDQRINTESSVENVRAYYRWNDNLTNASTLTVIILLAAARSFFPSIFSVGVEESREWVPKYVDTKIDEAANEGRKDDNERG